MTTCGQAKWLPPRLKTTHVEMQYHWPLDPDLKKWEVPLMCILVAMENYFSNIKVKFLDHVQATHYHSQQWWLPLAHPSTQSQTSSHTSWAYCVTVILFASTYIIMMTWIKCFITLIRSFQKRFVLRHSFVSDFGKDIKHPHHYCISEPKSHTFSLCSLFMFPPFHN